MYRGKINPKYHENRCSSQTSHVDSFVPFIFEVTCKPKVSKFNLKELIIMQTKKENIYHTIIFPVVG